MRIVFLGTPGVAVVVLRALVGAGHDVVLAVSRADTRRGRYAAPSPSPVKAAALELDIPVTDRPADVAGARAELGVVVAYGRIIRPEVLAVLPMVNLHFSLLPRWRGAAPVERALLAGDRETGVCLMKLEEGLDTGGLYGCARTPINHDETAEELRARLARMGSTLLLDTLATGLGQPSPQMGEPTYAAKVGVEERRLDFRQPAQVLGRTVRVGRAWTTFRGRRLLVHEARVVAGSYGEPGVLAGPVVATGSGGLELVRVQPEGRRPMAAREWLRGARPAPDDRLGQ